MWTAWPVSTLSLSGEAPLSFFRAALPSPLVAMGMDLWPDLCSARAHSCTWTIPLDMSGDSSPLSPNTWSLRAILLCSTRRFRARAQHLQSPGNEVCRCSAPEQTLLLHTYRTWPTKRVYRSEGVRSRIASMCCKSQIRFVYYSRRPDCCAPKPKSLQLSITEYR